MKDEIWLSSIPFLPGQEDSSILPITGCFVSSVTARSLRAGVAFNPEGVGTRRGKWRPFPVIPVFIASRRACETETPFRSPV